MKNSFKSIIFILTLFFISVSGITNENNIKAQDIPELHMVILQGDILVAGSSNAEIDGLTMHAKINGTTVGSVVISDKTTSSRYVGLEIGPNEALEGNMISFSIGNQVANETIPFGPISPSGTYCKGCSWVLPLSRTLDLNFTTFPQATPTPVPALAPPAFLTGNVIFGSVLSAPDNLTEIQAYIDNELVGSGTVKGPDFSITIDPGTVEYEGKSVIFKIAGTSSKSSYNFLADDFQTNFKLFFPEYTPPTPTPTVVVVPIPTAIPTATSTPEPTRTPTPVPEPTATYTATPTPTPIVFNSSSEPTTLTADSADGGCNSRGGGPASAGLILLSLAPVYLLNRKRKTK